jgi:hypothetical protein
MAIDYGMLYAIFNQMMIAVLIATTEAGLNYIKTEVE